ncbi:MAG TPA: amidohydrolase family protein [Actinophytocola sp.]|uniref:amidohydrolase family protein n=1 Tax=Actinophytocola sp. TaxID=1872138 RepID=UPI002DB80CCC|nr:amidohydrolase family protein [Actinophytocola sp.]HEU5471294.1 amidohydrolase family protein [Actinophytocola sp.]
MSEANRRGFLSWLSRSGLAIAAVGAGGVWPATAMAERSNVLVFTNATLIDGTGALPRPGTTIVVAGNRIAAVGRHGIAPPDGVRVVDLRGKYVLPGLWEMHSHTIDLERILAPSFIVNGVTSVREMWGTPHVRAVREQIESGALLGPRMVLASNIIDGPDSMLAGFAGNNPIQVRTVAQARAAVRQAKRDDADFAKLYSFLRRDTFVAAAEEARRLGVPIAGHVPDRLPVTLGSELGMRSQEHLYALYVDVSSARDEIRRTIENTPVDPANPLAFFFTVRGLEREAIKSYDPRRAAEVFATLARNRTALCPTLSVTRVFCFPEEEFLPDPRLRYVPPWVRQIWDDSVPTEAELPPGELEAGREFFDATLRLVAEANRDGVRFIPGTDVNYLAPYQFAGWSLHDELALLVRAGLSPMQAILAATREAARTVDRLHVSGTVSPGKFADLLVLDADPLADIRNTQRIHAVVANGRLITGAERDRILAEIEAEALRTPPPAGGQRPARPCCAVPR